jgi:hypothetical protein
MALVLGSSGQGRAEASPMKPIVFKDTVRSVTEASGGFAITFRQHAAVYTLDGKLPTLAQVKERLQESQKDRSPVTVEVDPTEMTIQGVK